MTQDPSTPQRTLPDSARQGLVVATAATAGVAVGAMMVLAWQQLPAPARLLLPWAGLALLTVSVVAWWRWSTAQDRRDHVRQALQDQRLQQLERRARQLDEAEGLVAVGSFDWFPATDDLYWSEQHYRLWGCEPGAVKPDYELYRSRLHPEDAERVLACLQQALAGSGRYDCRHRVLHGDGSLRHVHARGEVHFGPDGKPARMTGAVADITERVAAEARLRLHAFVLDAIPDPVGVVDGDRRYRLVNRAWLAVNGRTREETLGCTIASVYPGLITPEREQALQASLGGRAPPPVRSPSLSPNGAGRRIETRYFPFRDPGVDWTGAVMVTRDISEDEAIRTALRASNDNLLLTLNSIGDAIYASDAASIDEPVLFANEQLLDVFRIPSQPGVPLTPRTIIDHASRLFPEPEAEMARIRAIVRDNLSCDDRMALNDGRVLMRRARATLREPRPVRVWVFRDITAEVQAQRALADAEARQRTLLTAFPGFIWVFDQAERLVYLNPAAAEVYRPLEPRPGLPAAKLFGPEVSARVLPKLRRALAGETISMEFHRRSASGRSPDDLLIKMVPGSTPAGESLCYAFGIDISSLKQAQAALVAARDEAQRANQAKTQFLSSMSHELRTPLNAVIGFSQLLEHNTDGNLNERQVRQLGEIRRAGSHLLALINDLLDLARIEAGRTALELRSVPLAEVADECVQLLQPLLHRQGQALVLEPSAPLQVMADRMRLKQVLLNLLSNAIQYNRPQGQVWLGWQAGPEGVELTVRDQGPGLTEQAQSRLFQPFERLGAEAGPTVGTGIGLALSRQLVELMHGTIGVRSVPGQGACFWVRLPAAGGPGPQAARLLYLDDNPVNLALMEGLLEGRTDLRLSLCDNPSQALALLRDRAADALLLDLQMPGIDGFQVHARLQDDAATRGLPVVAVSADVTPDTRARCRALGFVDYVTKPIDADRLTAAVDRLIEAARTNGSINGPPPGPPST